MPFRELARGRVAAYWVGLVWLARVAEGSSASARAAVSRSGYFGDIAFLAIYLGVCGALLLGCFCGDPQGYAEGDPRSRSLLDAWAWLITVKIPAIATTCILKLPCGAAIVRRAEATKEYVCYKPNPLIQIFYLAVVFGVIGIFIFEAYPYIPNPRLSWWHRYTGYLAMATALVSFVVASTTSPGRITKATVARYNHYPYDNFLFVEQTCRTCKTPKLPRSKHCAICGHCVPKFDHHCPWINNCVGERNHIHFLFFLLANGALLTYGAFASAQILLSRIDAHKLYESRFVHRVTGERIGASHTIIFRYMFSNYSMLMCAFFICAILSVCVM